VLIGHIVVVYFLLTFDVDVHAYRKLAACVIFSTSAKYLFAVIFGEFICMFVLQSNLFPTVGLQTPGEVVEANFGRCPFVFDIEDYVQVTFAYTSQTRK